MIRADLNERYPEHSGFTLKADNRYLTGEFVTGNMTPIRLRNSPRILSEPALPQRPGAALSV